MGPKVESVLRFLHERRQRSRDYFVRASVRCGVGARRERTLCAIAMKSTTCCRSELRVSGAWVRSMQIIEQPTKLQPCKSKAQPRELKACCRVAAIHGSTADGAVRPLAADGAHRGARRHARLSEQDPGQPVLSAVHAHALLLRGGDAATGRTRALHRTRAGILVGDRRRAGRRLDPHHWRVLRRDRDPAS